jgi:5-methylthioadenosine/S-adenosylhomocysteine deaminase
MTAVGRGADGKTAPGVVVNQMSPGNVDTVFIAGKVKKWRGNLVGVDVPRVLR